MNTENAKTLTISLIKDDLINYKLVSALQDLGLDGLDYFVSLSTTVFNLMGFDDERESDQVYELYLQKAKRVKRMNIKTSHAALDAFALEIYLMLESKAPKKSADQLVILKHPNKISRVKRNVVAA